MGAGTCRPEQVDLQRDGFYGPAADPSGFRPDRRNCSASSSRPLPSQRLGQSPGGIPVAGVDPGAQPVQITALEHPPGQRPGSTAAACTGEDGHCFPGVVQGTAVALQFGQVPGRGAVSGVGPGAQLVHVIVRVQ